MKKAVRRNSAFWVGAFLGAASLVAALALSGRSGWGTRGGRAAGRPPDRIPISAVRPTPARRLVRQPWAGAGSPSETGASDISNLGTGGWKVLSSATATQTGAQISTPGFNTSSWLSVANDDAAAPGTEIEALAQNGLCPGDTAAAGEPIHEQPEQRVLLQQHAALLRVHDQDRARFGEHVQVPWWWRTDFTPNLAAGQTATLIVNGVVGSANVWVNGTQVASSATVTGAYTRFTFNISTWPCRERTRWRSKSTPMTRRRCSRPTTWTGRRSRRTTTPASSSRFSSRSTAP